MNKITEAGKNPSYYVDPLTETILSKIEVGRKYRVLLYEMEQRLILLAVGHHDNIYNDKKLKRLEKTVENEYL